MRERGKECEMGVYVMNACAMGGKMRTVDWLPQDETLADYADTE